MHEYEIDCEECGIGTLLHSYDSPDFCPLCGCKVESVLVDKGLEEDFYIDD
tara:strand:+ start:608 stop:760 length:153 start_codon:yes stop_codon:yes gene_type:complete